MPEQHKCNEHSGFNERITTNGNDIAELKTTAHAIFAKLDDLTVNLLSRHGWGTTVIISVLISLLSAAVTVAVVANGKGG